MLTKEKQAIWNKGYHAGIIVGKEEAKQSLRLTAIELEKEIRLNFKNPTMNVLDFLRGLIKSI